MPIRPPSLDDRRFDDLVAELVARIPAHTPEWTNPRAGDPGRTLIELFAWLGDALLYRANLIPERQRLAFLRLLGQPLRAARPARGLVTLALKDSETIAAHTLLPGASFTGPLPFEARHEITVLPVTLGAFYKRPTSAAEIEPGLEEALATLQGQGHGMKLYVAAPLFNGGAPAPEGFDGFAAPADRCVWLGLFASKAKGEPQAVTNQKVLAALDAAADGNRPLLNVGLVPALPPAEALPLTQGAARGAVPHVWEISVNTTNQTVDETHAWVPEYVALEEITDTTRGLTQPGVVRLALPLSKILHAPTSDVRADTHAGVGDRPPRLDDADQAARLIAWIRLRPKPGPAPAPPTATQFTSGRPTTPPTAPGASGEVEHLYLSWLGLNALEVEQLTTRANVIVGESDGTADQEFSLAATSVVPETLQLTVEGDDETRAWQRVDYLAALDRDPQSARDARVFELDAEAGMVKFGDGVRGRIPPAGRRIVVTQMRAGGGAAGNVPAATLKKVSARNAGNIDVGAKFEIGQPLALSGGADAENLRDAERRIPAAFRHRERAVTAEDYRTLALETPGVFVGRVEVLPLFKPQQRMENLPGIVTVMALPDAPLGPAPNPRADRPFLEAVHAWLDARRPLGTELYVIGCEYVPVSVSVAISLRDGAEPTVTEQAVKAALRRALWPLPGGGFDGNGWKLAHEISNRELAVEVARVAGVAEVAGLNLFTVDSASGKWRAHEHATDGREQDLALAKWQLPELRAVTVTFGDSAPVTLTAPNPYADDQSVAVPVVPKLC